MAVRLGGLHIAQSKCDHTGDTHLAQRDYSPGVEIMGQDDPALDPGLFTFEYIAFDTHYTTRLMEDRGDDTAISHYSSTEPSPSVVQSKVVIES